MTVLLFEVIRPQLLAMFAHIRQDLVPFLRPSRTVFTNRHIREAGDFRYLNAERFKFNGETLYEFSSLKLVDSGYRRLQWNKMENNIAHHTYSISAEQLTAVVGTLLEGAADRGTRNREPQRWDHLVRLVLDRLYRNSSDPSFDSLGSILDRVALNPQPLPPKAVLLKALAREFVNRAELLEEFAIATEQRGIIIIGGYVGSFVDDFCGNSFRLPWLHPGPPPPHWANGELGGADLLVLASQFALAARQAFSADLREAFVEAAAKFAESSVLKLQAIDPSSA